MITTENLSHWKASNNLIKITIKNDDGTYASFLNFGATLLEFGVKNSKSEITDICLGYADISDYFDNGAYLGNIIGRCANRIKNSHFVLNDKEYNLSANEGRNHLHGGKNGFNKHFFDYFMGDNFVKFSHFSPDLSEGYPGNLHFSVTYTLKENSLNICYEAESDADTIFNPTIHAYYNLSGEETILNHELKIYADYITEIDEELIPTGTLSEVKDTPFDFNEFKKIGSDIKNKQVYENTKGYDHNFALRGEGLRLIAQLKSENSGLLLNLYSDMPGLQVYTSNYFDGLKGKNGEVYGKYKAVALEPQFFPDSINHDNFPSYVLKKGEKFKSETLIEVKG